MKNEGKTSVGEQGVCKEAPVSNKDHKNQIESDETSLASLPIPPTCPENPENLCASEVEFKLVTVIELCPQVQKELENTKEGKKEEADESSGVLILPIPKPKVCVCPKSTDSGPSVKSVCSSGFKYDETSKLGFDFCKEEMENLEATADTFEPDPWPLPANCPDYKNECTKDKKKIENTINESKGAKEKSTKSKMDKIRCNLGKKSDS